MTLGEPTGLELPEVELAANGKGKLFEVMGEAIGDELKFVAPSVGGSNVKLLLVISKVALVSVPLDSLLLFNRSFRSSEFF